MQHNMGALLIAIGFHGLVAVYTPVPTAQAPILCSMLLPSSADSADTRPALTHDGHASAPMTTISLT